MNNFSIFLLLHLFLVLSPPHFHAARFYRVLSIFFTSLRNVETFLFFIFSAFFSRLNISIVGCVRVRVGVNTKELTYDISFFLLLLCCLPFIQYSPSTWLECFPCHYRVCPLHWRQKKCFFLLFGRISIRQNEWRKKKKRIWTFEEKYKRNGRCWWLGQMEAGLLFGLCCC